MPSGTQVSAFADSELNVHFREAYISEGLNQKLIGAAARGIYRGFMVTPTPLANRSITLKPDPVFLDHIAVVESYENPNGFSISVQKTGGDIIFDFNSAPLSTFQGQVAIIAIYVTYTVATVTAGQIRAYTVAQYNGITAAERSSLVVVAKITVPVALTPLTTADISYDERTEPWTTAGQAALPPQQLIRNPSFEFVEDTKTGRFSVPNWELVKTGNTGWTTISSDPSDAPFGTKSLEMSYALVTTPAGGTARQQIMAKVNPSDKIRVAFSIKCLKIFFSGTASYGITWKKKDGTVSSTVTTSISMSAVDSSYRRFDTLFTAPSDAYFLDSIIFTIAAATAASDGVLVHLDDVQIWVDTRTGAKAAKFDQIGPVATSNLLLDPVDGGTNFTNRDEQLSLFGSGTTPFTVTGRRRDALTSLINPMLDWYGTVRAGEGLPSDQTARLAARYLTTTGTSDYTLLFESAPNIGSTTPTTRVYTGINGRVYITSNAKAVGTGGGTWQKDVAAAGATAIIMIGEVITLASQTAVFVGTWADAGWVNAGGNYAGGPNWADGTTNPGPISIEGQLDKIITDLATGNGGAKIRYGTTGLIWADATSAINTASPQPQVQAQLDKIVTDLGTGAGAAKVATTTGPVWLDTSTNAAGSVQIQLDRIVNRLSDQTGSFSGARKIGAESSPVTFAGAPYSLATGSAYSQILSLLGSSNNDYRIRLAVTPTHAVDTGGVRDAIIIMGAACTQVTLPAASANAGRKLFLIHDGAGNVTLQRSGGDTINGVAGSITLGITTSGWYLATSDGTSKWYVAYGGSEFVNAAAKGSAPYDLLAGTVSSQLVELEGNDHTLQTNINTVQSNVNTVQSNLTSFANSFYKIYDYSAVNMTGAVTDTLSIIAAGTINMGIGPVVYVYTNIVVRFATVGDTFLVAMRLSDVPSGPGSFYTPLNYPYSAGSGPSGYEYQIRAGDANNRKLPGIFSVVNIPGGGNAKYVQMIGYMANPGGTATADFGIVGIRTQLT